MKMMFADLKNIFRLGWRERRTWRFFFQYLWWGYTDQDTWSVDYYVARKLKHVFPRFRSLSDSRILAPADDYKDIQDEIDLYVADGGHDNERFQAKVSNRLIEFWW